MSAKRRHTRLTTLSGGLLVPRAIKLAFLLGGLPDQRAPCEVGTFLVDYRDQRHSRLPATSTRYNGIPWHRLRWMMLLEAGAR